MSAAELDQKSETGREERGGEGERRAPRADLDVVEDNEGTIDGADGPVVCPRLDVVLFNGGSLEGRGAGRRTSREGQGMGERGGSEGEGQLSGSPSSLTSSGGPYCVDLERLALGDAGGRHASG